MARITIVSIITLVVSLFGIIFWIYWAYKFKEIWLYSIPPISWLINVLVLIGIKYLGSDLELFHFWSVVVRLHGVILVTSGVCVGLIGYARRQERKQKIIEEKF